MTDRLTLQLTDAQSGHKAMAFAWAKVKPLLMAGHRLQLQIKPETRSLAQNRLLHSALHDVSKQVRGVIELDADGQPAMVWRVSDTGRAVDVDSWRRLFTAAWLRARGESVEVLPAIDGHGVDVVFERTSRMSKAQLSELTEYVWAWGSERGVEWSPTSLGEEA